MAMKLGQSQRMIQSQVIAPQLQQAIKMLALTHMEMTDLITQELVENPLLEEIGPDQHEGELESDRSETVDDEGQNFSEASDAISNDATEFSESDKSEVSESKIKDIQDDFDWEKYLEPYSDYTAPNSQSSQDQTLDEDMPNFESYLAKSVGLAEHLEQQMVMEHLDISEQEFAKAIIHNIDSDGFLELDWKVLAEQMQISATRAHSILQMIQRLDPAGCATSNTKESLIVQAEQLDDTPLALIKIIDLYLEDLYRKNYDLIQKKLGIDQATLKRCEQLLMTLHPRPGRQISSENPHYIVPDIYVREVGGEFVVDVNNDGIPELRISKLYKSLLKNPKQDGTSKDYIKEKLRSAVWLMKSIENRQKTIEKVAQAIVRFQPEFFRKGHQYLKPMILRDVANEIGMHESTVSRVTTNKYMHTPMGVFELKYFFNSGVGSRSGSDGTTGEVIKIKIKNLIEEEEPKSPLSDEKLVLILSELGIEVARRTVAKYRDELGILSSAKRKK